MFTCLCGCSSTEFSIAQFFEKHKHLFQKTFQPHKKFSTVFLYFPYLSSIPFFHKTTPPKLTIGQFFVRSGAVWSDGRVGPGTGTDAVFWSSRADPAASFQAAFYLYFGASGVAPPSYDNRWYGFPLRRLVR